MFAYNLECLEGQYYSCAAFGTPLNTSITGNGPAPSSTPFFFFLLQACTAAVCLHVVFSAQRMWAPSVGCTKANLSSLVGAYAAELAREETDHVADLYAALTAAGYSPMCPYVAIGAVYCHTYNHAARSVGC